MNLLDRYKIFFLILSISFTSFSLQAMEVALPKKGKQLHDTRQESDSEESNADKCPTCEKFVTDKNIVIFSCYHFLCDTCCNVWKHRGNYCPICKKQTLGYRQRTWTDLHNHRNVKSLQDEVKRIIGENEKLSKRVEKIRTSKKYWKRSHNEMSEVVREFLNSPYKRTCEELEEKKQEVDNLKREAERHAQLEEKMTQWQPGSSKAAPGRWPPPADRASAWPKGCWLSPPKTPSGRRCRRRAARRLKPESPCQ